MLHDFDIALHWQIKFWKVKTLKNFPKIIQNKGFCPNEKNEFQIDISKMFNQNPTGPSKYETKKRADKYPTNIIEARCSGLVF